MRRILLGLKSQFSTFNSARWGKILLLLMFLQALIGGCNKEGGAPPPPPPPETKGTIQGSYGVSHNKPSKLKWGALQGTLQPQFDGPASGISVTAQSPKTITRGEATTGVGKAFYNLCDGFCLDPAGDYIVKAQSTRGGNYYRTDVEKPGNWVYFSPREK